MKSGIIEDIKQKENLVLLVKNKAYRANWQHPKKITEYVIENYEKTGNVDIYDVYEK